MPQGLPVAKRSLRIREPKPRMAERALTFLKMQRGVPATLAEVREAVDVALRSADLLHKQLLKLPGVEASESGQLVWNYPSREVALARLADRMRSDAHVAQANSDEVVADYFAARAQHYDHLAGASSFKDGDRVRFVKPYEVSLPLALHVEAGDTGTLCNTDEEGSVWLRLDKHHDGLTMWDNRIVIGSQEDRAEELGLYLEHLLV